MTDQVQAPEVIWEDHDGTEHRIRFEPTPSGDWSRIKEVRDQTAAPVSWRIQGSERVSGVGFKAVPFGCVGEPAAPADD